MVLIKCIGSYKNMVYFYYFSNKIDLTSTVEFINAVGSFFLIVDFFLSNIPRFEEPLKCMAKPAVWRLTGSILRYRRDKWALKGAVGSARRRATTKINTSRYSNSLQTKQVYWCRHDSGAVWFDVHLRASPLSVMYTCASTACWQS